MVLIIEHYDFKKKSGAVLKIDVRNSEKLQETEMNENPEN